MSDIEDYNTNTEGINDEDMEYTSFTGLMIIAKGQ